MPSLRLYNARYLSPNGKEILQGELWVEGGNISALGVAVPAESPADREIDLQGNLILPGFKNAHGHAPMVFLRSLAENLPLDRWLNEVVFPIEERLTEKQAYEFAKLALLEYLSTGITSSFEMYIYPDAIATAAKELGFRVVLCGAVNDFTHSVKELENQFSRYNQPSSPLITMQLGFHGEYTTKEKTIREIGELAHQHKAPVFTHLSETRGETENCIQRTGKTPTAYLEELGIWDHGGGGFHCVHVNQKDLEIFQRRNLAVVTNSGSNAKLSSGIAPLGAMRHRNIPIGIGTDGAASNNALDMFREIYLTSILQNIATNTPGTLPAEEILSMACHTGGELMGLGDTTLTVGNLADLVVLDLNQPNMQPENHLIDNLVYSGSKSNVLFTIVNGQILYEKGAFPTAEDPEELYTRCTSIVKGLL